jgi:hypothetical protein
MNYDERKTVHRALHQVYKVIDLEYLNSAGKTRKPHCRQRRDCYFWSMDNTPQHNVLKILDTDWSRTGDPSDTA